MSTTIRSAYFLAAAISISACNGAATPMDAPITTITKVTSAGFKAPTDAVSSPDGATFYFAAQTETGQPAIFKVASTAGSPATAMVSGAPLVSPTGLVLSCDGATLYVADGGATPIYSLPTSGGALTPLGVTAVGKAVGLAMADDCQTLYATGRTTDDRPALFKVDRAGGAAQLVFAGSPLIAPVGVFVDPHNIAWVMDQIAAGGVSAGALYAVASDGSPPKTVLGNLAMQGHVGGVSLNSKGDTAVIADRAANGSGQLTTVVLATGARVDVAAPEIKGPAGLRTARSAAVFAVVDSEGGAIYRAE